MAAHDSNFTYREGQGDFLVTKWFKVIHTLQARCVFTQFLLESTIWTKKCKKLQSLQCFTLQAQLTRAPTHARVSWDPFQILTVDTGEVSVKNTHLM